jgi:CBS domain-containing protein
MTTGRICVRGVDTADVNESVRVAAQRMHDRNVGTLVITNSAGRPIGILTDRDLVVKVLAKGLDAVDTTVGSVMSSQLKTVDEATPIEQTLALMRTSSVRRVPVVDDDGKLAGLVSLDDILDLMAEEFRDIGELLRREGPRVLSQQ